MVITVPTPLVVQGDEKEVGMFEVFQGFLPGKRWIEGDGVAKGTAEAFEDRRLQQEVLEALGLPFQDFLQQIIEDETVAAGEGSE